MFIGLGKSGIISCFLYFLGKLGLSLLFILDYDLEGELFYRFNKFVLVIVLDFVIVS